SVTVGRNIYLWLWGWEVAAVYSAGAGGLAAWFCAVYGALHPVMCAVVATSAVYLAAAVTYFYLQPRSVRGRYVIAIRPWGTFNDMDRQAGNGCSHFKYELPG